MCMDFYFYLFRYINYKIIHNDDIYTHEAKQYWTEIKLAKLYVSRHI